MQVLTALAGLPGLICLIFGMRSVMPSAGVCRQQDSGLLGRICMLSDAELAADCGNQSQVGQRPGNGTRPASSLPPSSLTQ